LNIQRHPLRTGKTEIIGTTPPAGISSTTSCPQVPVMVPFQIDNPLSSNKIYSTLY